LDTERQGATVAGFSIPGDGITARTSPNVDWPAADPTAVETRLRASLTSAGFELRDLQEYSDGSRLGVSASVVVPEGTTVDDLHAIGEPLGRDGVAWLLRVVDAASGETVDVQTSVPWIGVSSHWPASGGAAQQGTAFSADVSPAASMIAT
jgi:hypothetical protein